MNLFKLCLISLFAAIAGGVGMAQMPDKANPVPQAKASSPESKLPLLAHTVPSDLANQLGISFPNGAQSSFVLVRDGRQYLIDVSAKTISEIHTTAAEGPLAAPTGEMAAARSLFSKNCAACHGADGKGIKSVGTPNFTDPNFGRNVSAETIKLVIQRGKGNIMPAWSGRLTDQQISSLVTYIRSLAPDTAASGTNLATNTGAPAVPEQAPQKPDIYQPGDDVLISLPTAKPTDRHGIYVNFAHRFPYSPAFSGPAEGAQLFGLDNVAIPSFGFRYGVTDNLSVSVFRAPSLINRPIQLMAGYNILEERKGDGLNFMVRVSIEGQDNFRKNYTENIEGIIARSITSKAQLYLVPAVSFNDRRLEQPSGFLSSQIPDVPGVNAFSLGTGLAIDIRPSVALLAEVIPTLVNARELGIHRPVFSFGVQKKIWRHSFTLGLTTSPGTTVSQRAGTRAQFLNDPSADTLGGLVLGFDLTRQIK